MEVKNPKAGNSKPYDNERPEPEQTSLTYERRRILFGVRLREIRRLPGPVGCYLPRQHRDSGRPGQIECAARIR